MPEGLKLRLEPCRYCGTCPASYFCDEGTTEFGCDNEFTLPQSGRTGGRDVMHPLRPDLTERLWECGGLDIGIRTHAAQQPLPVLPAYISRVQATVGFSAPQWPAVGVPLDRVGTSAPVRTATEMKADLGLPSETIVIVSSFQGDAVLERAWGCRQTLVESLATAGYDLVTVPNFSLWQGEPPLEHRYNIARSLRMFEMLVEAGVPTIPHVSWYLLKRDVDAWIQELNRWPGLRAFSLDLATLKTKQWWAWGLERLRRLFDGVGREWEVLVNGVARPRRIREVSRICGHVHVMNERPFQLAMSQHETVDDLSGRTRRTTKPRMDIFASELEKQVNAVPPPPASCCLAMPSAVHA